MPTTILRLRSGPSLPHQAQRIAVLAKHFGEPVTITDIWPPADPEDLLRYIVDKILALKPAAIEMDSMDRMLATMMAAGAWTTIFGGTPVLYPVYRNQQGEGFPKLTLGSHKVEVPDDVYLVGYAELCDAVPVPTLREDIAL